MPVLLWMALIFIMSAQSQLPSPEQRWLDFVVEKSAHTFEFAVLAFLVLRALDGSGAPGWQIWAGTLLLSWFYALTDEFHQRYVPGRSADWMDILFDWMGALIGLGLGWYWRRRAETD